MLAPLFGDARSGFVGKAPSRASALLQCRSWPGLRGCTHTADNKRLTHPRSPSEYSKPSAMTIVRMTDLDLSGQRVLIRQGEPV